MLSVDQLYPLLESSPLLDRVEAALIAAGKLMSAQKLNKLQQDAGVQVDRAFTGAEPGDPAPGPQSAKLNAAYEPVTADRLNGTLRDSYMMLNDGGVKQELGALLPKLLAPESAPAAPGKPSLQ